MKKITWVFFGVLDTSLLIVILGFVFGFHYLALAAVMLTISAVLSAKCEMKDWMTIVLTISAVCFILFSNGIALPTILSFLFK